MMNVDLDMAKPIEMFEGSSVKHEGFWLERLATPQPIVIPYAKTISIAINEPIIQRSDWAVPDEVATFISGHPLGWTVSNFLLTAFIVYLARISQTWQFDIGFKSSQKNQFLQLESFFAEYVPCRVEIEHQQSFEQVFEAVQKQIDLTAQDITELRDLVEKYPELCSKWKESSEYRYSVLVEQVKRLDASDMKPVCQLLLSIPEDEKKCYWVYNSDIFDDDSITRMQDQFTTFVQSIVAETNRRVAELSLLSEKELKKILVEWNNTESEYPKDKCIHQLFEQQVKLTPNAIAVVYEEQQLTYQELNARANQLAHYLQNLDVKPETLVGICVDRSVEMVVGLLGILKAGGAYVPLDPSYPKQRIAYMLEDSRVAALLTQQRLVASLPEHRAALVLLDADWEEISQQKSENPCTAVTPANLAYTIYTSGSTGQPKGVMISHSNLCNHMFWMQATFPLTEKDKVLQKTPFSFDASVWEFYAPLLVGGQLLIAKPGGHADSAYLLRLIAQQQVTTVQLVPSLLQMLLEQGGIETCRSLKQVFCGGEVLPIDLLKGLLSKLNVNLCNLYGPTEACIDTIFWNSNAQINEQLVPIGRPISNTQIYILDQNLQPVPVGVPGEIYIGGVCLARGYLNRPELTSEKFICNPFDNSSRLYKTGDLARYKSDGNIEYLGRIDHQVKVRGFRIELGEIEAALREHVNVRDAVVVVQEERPGNKRLVAYVVLNQDVTNESALRHFLADKLPDHMVPSVFVILAALPLSPNGKVDRKALPAPEKLRQPAQETFVPARNEIESQLTTIWEEVLDIQPIGVKDNFFALGGHSLLAMRVFVQIEQKLGQHLPLTTLLEAPTVEQLAHVISQRDENLKNDQSKIETQNTTNETRQADAASTRSSLVCMQPNGSKPPLFCVHALGYSVLYYQNLANYLGTDQPFYALQPRGLDGKQPLLTRIEDMASHYIREIQTVQPEGPYFLGGASFGGLVAWEMAQQLVAQGQKVALLALFDTPGLGFFRRAPLSKRIRNHLNSLSKLRFTYIYQQLKNKSDWLSIIFKQEIKKKSASTIPQQLPPSPTHKELKLIVEAANKQAQRNYVLRAYSGLVICFRATTHLAPSEGWELDPQMGWGDLAQGKLEIHPVPGDHDSIFREPNVRTLAEELRACLNKVQSKQL
jgi:amino acid adenylation domain-containing protein